MNKVLQKFLKGYAVLEEVASPINDKIQVWEDWFGGKRLVVGGISQSGDLVEKVWKIGLRNLKTERPKNILILGLGAGSAAKLISQRWPGVKITGIEIDPEIISLGEKYFGLGEINNLEIITQDAISTVIDQKSSTIYFDVILVDLYLGDQVPSETEGDKFLGKINKNLSPGGLVIFNRLYFGKYREKTDKFEEKLKKFFAEIEAKKVKTNKLFLCLNKGTNEAS